MCFNRDTQVFPLCRRPIVCARHLTHDHREAGLPRVACEVEIIRGRLLVEIERLAGDRVGEEGRVLMLEVPDSLHVVERFTDRPYTWRLRHGPENSENLPRLILVVV